MTFETRRLDWNHLRAFLATAETGSLSAAARNLALTQPTLSRQIAALEDDLSVMLFERVGRRLELTDAGKELLRHVRDMGEAAHRVSLSAAGQSSEISGLVRIAASDITSATFLPGFLLELRETAPQLSVEIVARNDIQDLMRREADIAIRHVRPDQPDLVARLIQTVTGHFYASRAYLDRRGTPTTRAEMAQHDWVGFGDLDVMISYMAGLDIPVTRERFKVSSENGLVAWEMARAGHGVCPMDDNVARACPEMQRILGDDLQVAFPVWLVTHREVHTSPKIRLVYDRLAEALAAR